MHWMGLGKCAPLLKKARTITVRQVSRRRTPRRLALQFELFEERLTPSLFLQGQVLNDVTLTPLPNAVITLEDSSGNPLLNNGTPITTTTDANGNYRFDETNTFGMLVAGATYRLMQTPPSGFANDSTQIAPNQFDPASQVNASTIQVTLTDPAQVQITFDFNQFVAQGLEEPVQFQLLEADNTYHTLSGRVGNIPITISGLPAGGSISIQSLCINALQNFQTGVNVFNAVPQPLPPFTNNQPVFNAGRIAYLYNHFGTTLSADADHAAALQIAVFELLYDPTPDLNSGNFIYNQSPAIAALANQYIALSAGKSENAVFLNAIAPPLQGGLQGVMAPGSLNFSNIFQPSIVTVPSAPVLLGSGVRLSDTAILSGGLAPTGTITFTLFDPSGTAVYTDTVSVSNNGNFDTSTGNNPGGFLPSVVGTYNWLAVYSGDPNNHSASTRFGDEQVTVGQLSKRFFLTENAVAAPAMLGLPAAALFGPSGPVTDPLPVFTWAPIANAGHYDIWIDDTTAGQSQVVRNVNLPQPTFTPNVPFIIGHSYEWWVRGIAADGTPGAWSAGIVFSEVALPAPMPIGPAGETAVAQPTFSWLPVAGADHYDLWVNDLTTAQQQTIRVQNVAGTTYTAAVPLPVNHSFQWWVRAVTAGGAAGAWSSGNGFTEVAVGTPTPIGPKSTGPRAATFLWKAAPGADHYDLWVDDLTTGQSQVIRNQNVAGTSFQPATPLTLGDRYRWWARAINSSGVASPWSGPTDFDVVAFPAPSLISVIGPAAAPTFTWTAVAGANHYDLWVDDLSTGQSQVVRATNVTGTSFTSGPLASDQSYRWWVRAIDNNGLASPWSVPLDARLT